MAAVEIAAAGAATEGSADRPRREEAGIAEDGDAQGRFYVAE
jgi:hypothetical protein